VDARKKKKDEVAQQKYKKEKEIARHVKVEENKSDIESKLESRDPTDVDDMVFSEEEESWEVVVTSVECCDPMAMSAGDEQEAERRAVVPMPRKHVTSVDTIDGWEAKRTWSPCPSVASLVLSSPIVDVAEQVRWSKEQACTRASLGPVPACDS
jgi:hypothetical protein